MVPVEWKVRHLSLQTVILNERFGKSCASSIVMNYSYSDEPRWLSETECCMKETNHRMPTVWLYTVLRGQNYTMNYLGIHILGVKLQRKARE